MEQPGLTEILTFEPLLKQTLWGGDKIIPFKHLDTRLDQVGESWEVSGVAGSESVVRDGSFKGWKLNDVVARLKGQLVGAAAYGRYGNEFPLLVKFIDARRQLSIQVHPTDDQARARGLRRGKTEMWYVMQSEPGATLYSGLRRAITPADYERMVADGTITDALSLYQVSEGDVFFLPAGRIHSIGAGCFLAEIQETSDVTYRIYDFKRKDKDGHYRQLHTEEAKACIDYRVAPDYRTHYAPAKNEGVRLVGCPHFTTTLYDLDRPLSLDLSRLDSFIILIGLKGEATVTADGTATATLRAGSTLLLPATARAVEVTGTVKFLETHI